MRISKTPAFMYADITLKDLGECDVNKAVAEFESAPWQEQFAFSDMATCGGRTSEIEFKLLIFKKCMPTSL